MYSNREPNQNTRNPTRARLPIHLKDQTPKVISKFANISSSLDDPMIVGDPTPGIKIAFPYTLSEFWPWKAKSTSSMLVEFSSLVKLITLCGTWTLSMLKCGVLAHISWGDQDLWPAMLLSGPFCLSPGFGGEALFGLVDARLE